MIWELLLKTFIPVLRIFDNEDDIFTFSRNARKSSASENYLKKENENTPFKFDLLYFKLFQFNSNLTISSSSRDSFPNFESLR